MVHVSVAVVSDFAFFVDCVFALWGGISYKTCFSVTVRESEQLVFQFGGHVPD